jgi:hypothetical protein
MVLPRNLYFFCPLFFFLFWLQMLCSNAFKLFWLKCFYVLPCTSLFCRIFGYLSTFLPHFTVRSVLFHHFIVRLSLPFCWPFFCWFLFWFLSVFIVVFGFGFLALGLWSFVRPHPLKGSWNGGFKKKKQSGRKGRKAKQGTQSE